jgi:hypothetical protein
MQKNKLEHFCLALIIWQVAYHGPLVWNNLQSYSSNYSALWWARNPNLKIIFPCIGLGNYSFHSLISKNNTKCGQGQKAEFKKSYRLYHQLLLRVLNESCLILPCGLHYKSFIIVIYECNDSMIVIYDRNDSGLYYKSFTIVNYASEERNLGS